jgi:hypothetical protein
VSALDVIVDADDDIVATSSLTAWQDTADSEGISDGILFLAGLEVEGADLSFSEFGEDVFDLFGGIGWWKDAFEEVLVEDPGCSGLIFFPVAVELWLIEFFLWWDLHWVKIKMNKDSWNDRNVTKKSFSDDSFVGNRYTNSLNSFYILKTEKILIKFSINIRPNIGWI